MRKQCSCGCIHSLDWTTGLSYFPFLDKFLCLFLESRQHFYNQQVAGYHNNHNSCLLQCFQQYINLKLWYSHLINSYVDMCKLSLQLVPSFIAFFLPIYQLVYMVYCKSYEVEKFRSFRGSIGNQEAFPVK